MSEQATKVNGTIRIDGGTIVFTGGTGLTIAYFDGAFTPRTRLQNYSVPGILTINGNPGGFNGRKSISGQVDDRGVGLEVIGDKDMKIGYIQSVVLDLSSEPG